MFTYVFSVSLLILGAVQSQEIPKQNGQTPQVAAQEPVVQQTITECTNYRLTLGRYTNYFYTCCGKWKTDNPVAGTEEFVENWDCNPNRVYSKENETKFSCNGESGQAAARGICNARWGWLATDNCWAWPSCFAGACAKEASEPGSASLFDGFCGDGRCDADESADSCPSDCCPEVNPDECLIKNNTCTEACCSEPTCCSSSISNFFSNFWIIVFSVIGGVFLLINICCCCCCYCLFRRCKGVKREKRHPTTVDRQDTTMTVLSV
ncbi:uncharacterized protein LOC110977474 [Acanthaster planci]|uniref:Uncharacterized protein LOC110977474 n=1 Tax=Acanthaster planci TaxID=133434 RepID=A0A8B7Y473_ACAPL|nr:uncharacterized protein LOC110977474 [Acanthaster planci]